MTIAGNSTAGQRNLSFYFVCWAEAAWVLAKGPFQPVLWFPTADYLCFKVSPRDI